MYVSQSKNHLILIPSLQIPLKLSNKSTCATYLPTHDDGGMGLGRNVLFLDTTIISSSTRRIFDLIGINHAGVFFWPRTMRELECSKRTKENGERKKLEWRGLAFPHGLLMRIAGR